MSASTAPAAQPASQPSAQRWLPYFVCVAVALLYSPTLRFAFVYDDTSQIVLNPLIQSWRNLPLIFHTDVWRFQNPLVTGNFWRPVFMVWLMINHTLFGLHTVGWHATTVLAHIIATYLVYRLVFRIGGDAWLAGVAALLFAVHPTHLETVAWVSGVTDSLLTIFLVGSVLCFVRGWESESARRWLWIIASLLLYSLALLTKETAIIEPILVGAYVLVYTRERSGRKLGQSAILFALPTAAYLGERHVVLGGLTHPYLHMPAWQVLMAMPSVLWFYLSHLLWPVDLSVFYDVSPVTQAQWQNFWGPLCGVALFATVYVAYVIRSRDRLAIFAGVLHIVPLLPVLYIPVLEPGNFLHDRYLYLPSIGFSILVAIAIRHLRVRNAKLFGMPRLQAVTAGILFLACAAATSAQQIFWANDVLLFNRATEIAPANVAGFNNLGTALANRGHRKEAMFAFQQVIRRDPASWRGQYNVGLGYFLDGNYSEAEIYLEKAVELNPLEADPAAALAEARIRQGKFAAAEPVIRHAIAVKAYKPGYWRVLALSLEGQGKTREAVQAAETELARHPGDQQTRDLLIRLKHEMGQPDSFLPSN